jgi:Flp pilus assembly protein TadD
MPTTISISAWRYLKELERIGEALDASDRALAIEPDNVRALFHIASILERRGAIEQAREVAI